MTTAAIATIVNPYAGWSALGLLFLFALIFLWDRRHPRRSRFRLSGKPEAESVLESGYPLPGRHR